MAVVLHISDTPFSSYRWIQNILDKMRPDIVIHTGDMVDDIKIGRFPQKLPEYYEKVLPLLALLRNKKGRKIILVPGNHDDYGFIAEHVGANDMVLLEGTVLDLYGKRFGFAHQVTRIPREPVDFCLYGHGYTHDNWDPLWNKKNQTCHFNGFRFATCICLPSGSFENIPYPDEIFDSRLGKSGEVI
jgi:predicted phosphodiesterase